MTQENIERLNKIKMDICYDWKQIKLQDIAWLIEQADKLMHLESLSISIPSPKVEKLKHSEVHGNGDEA